MTVEALLVLDVNRTRWQHPYPGYFGFLPWEDVAKHFFYTLWFHNIKSTKARTKTDQNQNLTWFNIRSVHMGSHSDCFCAVCRLIRKDLFCFLILKKYLICSGQFSFFAVVSSVLFYANIVLNSGKVAITLGISSLIINIIFILHRCSAGLTVVLKILLLRVVAGQGCYLRRCHFWKIFNISETITLELFVRMTLMQLDKRK